MAFLLGAIDKHLRGMKQTFGGGESDAVGRCASAGYQEWKKEGGSLPEGGGGYK